MNTDRLTARILHTTEATDTALRYFGGTAYLGLPALPAFQDLLIANIRRWGTAYGASRIANIQVSAYEAAELKLQELTRMPAVRTLSSGMLAGKLAIEVLTPMTDRFYFLPNLHPALDAPNMEPVFLHPDVINPALLSDELERITILTDSVAAFQVNSVDFSFLDSIAASKIVTLVIDESHSLGLLGTHGGGIASAIQNPRIVRTVMVASLGKAMGVTGGMIASDEVFIQLLLSKPNFIGAAGMNPAMAQTLADGMALIHQQRRILQEKLDYFFAGWKHDEWLLKQSNYPVLYPKKTGLYEHLLKHQIVITHFQYATGNLDRIVVAAHHQESDLDALLLALDAWKL